MSKILTFDPKLKKILVRDLASNIFEQKLIKMNLPYTKGPVISVYSIGFSQYPFLIESTHISENQFKTLAEDCIDEALGNKQQDSLTDLFCSKTS